MHKKSPLGKTLSDFIWGGRFIKASIVHSNIAEMKNSLYHFFRNIKEMLLIEKKP